MVAHMSFDRDGRMRAHHFKRAIIVSRADLTYEEAQAAMDGRPPERAGSLADESLAPLWAAYAVLASAREAREPLDLDLPERRVLFDAAGQPTAIVTPPRLAAHRLIEEFMIQANVATAETLERRRAAFLRRVHDAPAAEKVDALGEYVQSLGFRFARGQALRTSHFNRLIAETAATPHGEAVAQAVLRAQSQALYEARDRGHFGLNLRRYAHFTSPIRRYADIIAHRALISALALGPDGNDRDTVAALDEIAIAVSEAERRAMAAERDTVGRLVARFLSARAGAVFAGRVAGVVRAGLFVELAETGASGFVAAAALGRAQNDYFVAEDATFSLRGRDSGLGYRIGASVEVRLLDADPLSGALEFEMLTPPGPIASRRRPARGSGKTARLRARPRRERVR
jgi:ribonuclease R